MASHCCPFHDVPPDGLVPAALAEVQQVVHYHLTNQVVSGETVEVVDGEVQLARMKLGQRHAELERLIKHGVQGLPVHLSGRAKEGRVDRPRKTEKKKERCQEERKKQ